jgi:putative nucleotidyltransferase with HDIG domain
MQEKFCLIEILKSDEPSQLLEIADTIGILNEHLPELIALKGIETIDGISHKDNYIHTLQVLKNTCIVSRDPYLRLVALLHDIGKAPTKKFENGKWSFTNHELVGTYMLKKIFERNDINFIHFDYVEKIIQYHGIIKELTKPEVTDSAIRRMCTDLGYMYNDAILFCKCDSTTSKPWKKELHMNDLSKLKDRAEAILKNDKEKAYRPPIDAHDIMAMFPDKPAGKWLTEAKDIVVFAIKNGIINENKEEALNFIKNFINDK